jgi:hypothetical protein
MFSYIWDCHKQIKRDIVPDKYKNVKGFSGSLRESQAKTLGQNYECVCECVFGF